MTNRDSLSSTITFPPLDYLQPSPVRGQLEPHTETTRRSGWRYLQCTDTPNELKVLLPPRTAQLYAVLLKAELNELAKRREASWERILDIRRLKDRMIRKCQRLAQTYSFSNPGARVPFLTLHAPHDFRLKEMEKWIRDQEGSEVVLKKSGSHSDGHKSRTAVWCDNCARLVSHHHTMSHRRSSTHAAQTHAMHARRSSTSRSHKSSSSRHVNATADAFVEVRPVPSPSASSLPLREFESQWTSNQEIELHQRTHEHSSIRESGESSHFSSHQINVEQEHVHLQASDHRQSESVEASVFVEESKLQRRKRDMHVIHEERESNNLSVLDDQQEVESVGHLSIASPDPLPIPCNGSLSSVFQDMVTSPGNVAYLGAVGDQERLPSEGSQSPPSEEEFAGSNGIAPPGTLRRRSNLKRSNSDLRMSMAYSAKTVSWAMDRDWTQQMAKYQVAAEEVGFVDREWGIICDKYKEELAGLKALRRNVTETLSKLKIETERLYREDEVIRDQEHKLRSGFEHLEQKHDQYRTKVKAVLHETEQVLVLCGTKRDGELHRS